MCASLSENFKKINSLLIDRERKDATYKFALLRGAIEICEKYDQHKVPSSNPDRVTFPLGLLVEQWMLYYFPIYEHEIPQQKSEKNNTGRTKFRMAFDPVIAHYRKNGGGYSQFASDLAKGTFSPDIHRPVFDFAKAICNKVTEMPMVHLGASLGERIFTDAKSLPRYDRDALISRDYLVKHFGTFSIRSDYYHAFVAAGPFMTGDKSIFFNWAWFTHDALCTKRSFGDLLKIIATEPVRERDIKDSRNFFDSVLKKEGSLQSVWSGRRISKFDEQALDHVIPFSVWKNNEMWNIMPALKGENQDKSDFIPHSDLLDRQKSIILQYWKAMYAYNPDLFMEQIRYSLIGSDAGETDWQEQAFLSLRRKCDYLINVLGYQPWRNE